MLLYAYKNGSQGARAVAQGLGIRRIRHEGSRFTGRSRPTVINWGANQLPEWRANCNIINAPEAVLSVADKLRFFRRVHEAGMDRRVPPWTDSREEAQRWVQDGRTVVARTVLRGHSGVGIRIISGDQLVPDAPLYVQYIKKIAEYRVHIVRGAIIDVQRKARRHDVAEPNWQVRSHQNGFVFVREEARPPGSVLDAARDVFGCFDLDFGAIDVIWNGKEERAYVLEINTAPGLEGTTVQRYVDAFGAFENVPQRVVQRPRRNGAAR